MGPDALLSALQAIILVVMVVGVFGLIVPIFPGITVIWLAALGYGLIAGFRTLGWVMFALITLLMVVGNVIDNVLINAKARTRGASWLSLGAGMLAGIVGSVLLPPLGGIPASFLAVFLVELIHLKDWRTALSFTRSMAIGCGWAFVIRAAIGLVMIGLWLIWALVK